MTNIELEIADKARGEIEKKTWGVTEQFLKVHSIVYTEGKPRIDRIDNDKSDGSVIAYLPVEGQDFHLAIYFRTNPDVEIEGVSTEPFSQVYFRASSDELNALELGKLTTLPPTKTINKGDKKIFGSGPNKFNSIQIELNPEPDEVEDKIEKLLDLLEQDKSGVQRLIDVAHGYVQITMSFHNGNTMLGGIHLDKKIIRRLSNLNLTLDWDLYAKGNFFIEE